MSDNVRVCPVCNIELSGKQRFCSDAHRKQFARKGDLPKGDPTPEPSQGDPVLNNLEETYDQRLERRVAETGSREITTFVTGSGKRLRIPSKWELEDIDYAMGTLK